MHYFAAAALKSYLFDALVWAIIGLVILIISLFLFKRSRISIIVCGALLLAGAPPAAGMTMLAVGDFETPNPWAVVLGISIGVVLAGLGILLIACSKRWAKQTASK